MNNIADMGKSPQEVLAYAWSILQSEFERSNMVSDRLIDRCRSSTELLTHDECYQLLPDIPLTEVT